MKDNEISKYLSLVLRHQPGVLGITLDAEGWTDVNVLLEKMRGKGMNVDFDRLKKVVDSNDKKRFAFASDYSKLRASQGHSVAVQLGLSPTQPPPYLYHGTSEANLSSILSQGIQKRSRQHVHLSADMETAEKVGRRHGKPCILLVKSGEMYQRGVEFYLSENKVWLTDFVDASYIQLPKQE